MSIGGTSTVRYPPEPPLRIVLPTREDAEHEARLSRVRTRVQNKILKLKAGDELRPALRPSKTSAAEAPAEAPAAESSEVVPKPKAKARGKAKAKAKAASAPRIRKVLITAIDPSSAPRRNRGRPAGSLGKKKRDALVEEELRRMSSVA